MRDETGEAKAGMVRLEGYLMSEAALREAREEANAFAQRLTWLGPGEQHEIAGLLAEHHLKGKREMLAAVVVRSEQLKAEYEARYEQLRRRLVCATVTSVAGTVAVLTALTMHATR